MFLVPKTAGSPRLPATFAESGSEARVSYVDDQPVFHADGDATFTIRRRRRLPFGRPAVETVGQSAPFRRLRRGDEVDLAIGGRTMTWRYSPNANLGRPARMALLTLKVATVVAGLGVAERVLNELAYNDMTFGYSSAPKLRVMSDQIRLNSTQIYPAADKGPSDFMRGLSRVRSEGGDMGSFSKQWSVDNPQPKQDEVKP